MHLLLRKPFALTCSPLHSILGWQVILLISAMDCRDVYGAISVDYTLSETAHRCISLPTTSSFSIPVVCAITSLLSLHSPAEQLPFVWLYLPTPRCCSMNIQRLVLVVRMLLYRMFLILGTPLSFSTFAALVLNTASNYYVRTLHPM